MCHCEKSFLLLLLTLFNFSCAEKEQENPLVHILETSQEAAIRTVIDDSEDPYEVQIQYTQIERENEEIRFTDFDYHINDSTYFYPASTVKFPVAVLALEKVSDSTGLTVHSRFYVEGDTVETTIGDEVVKIFAVSDNLANNRLFELLGQDSINHRLGSLGLTPVRIAHRLSTEDADDITTRPLIVYLNDSTTSHMEAVISAPLEPLNLENIRKGVGYIEEDSIVNEPFDFSYKNYYPIKTQQQLIKRVIFPQAFDPSERFNLNEDARALLLKAMSAPPRHWGYDSEEFYDCYGKFFICGDTKDPMPEHIRIYNKVGYAYGTLTDCAYIHDRENNIEFIISATILVNSNGVFNDDNYEYETVGIPFLAALGREIYNYEMKRK